MIKLWNILKRNKRRIGLVTLAIAIGLGVFLVVEGRNITGNDRLLGFGVAILALVFCVFLVAFLNKYEKHTEIKNANKLEALSHYGFIRDGVIFRAKYKGFYVMICPKADFSDEGEGEWIEIAIPVTNGRWYIEQKHIKFIESGHYNIYKNKKHWIFRTPKVDDIIQWTDKFIYLLKANNIRPVIPTEDIDMQGNIIMEKEVPLASVILH